MIRRILAGTLTVAVWVTVAILCTVGVVGVVALVTAPFTAPAPPPGVSIADLRVHVFKDSAVSAPRTKKFEPTEVGNLEVPFEREGVLHVFCNVRRGHLVYIYERQVAVIEGGCK